MEDIIKMSMTEAKRLHIAQSISEGRIKQVEAAEMLCLSDRQMRRIIERYRQEGPRGIIHKLRGCSSNRAFSNKFKGKVLKFYEKRYMGFGPTLASEKLKEEFGLSLSSETLRKWLLAEKLWLGQRKAKKHRQWRERKHYFGELIQLDGSHHDWFEGRGPKSVLMGYIDDATNRVHALFYEYEGTIPALDSLKRYIRRYGLPQSLYLDKHTTYKSNGKLTVEDELAGREMLSQFERAAKELGIHVIHAHSPQAIGRIERLFRTFQDRVIKEMRLKGVSSIEEANAFLKAYLPRYNKRFNIKPLEQKNVHQPLPKGFKLDSVLCIKEERTIRNDYTISYNSELYQIIQKIKAKKVCVEERINGSIVLSYQGKLLKFKKITNRPLKAGKFKKKSRRGKAVPAKNHPWRNSKITLAA